MNGRLAVAVRRRQGDFRLDAAFDAPLQGVTALFGASGSGKSTLVEILAGLRRPDAGRIAVGATVLFDGEAGIDLAPERRRVGYVFQDSRLFPHLGVRRNLLYGYRRAPSGERAITPEPMIEMLGIGPLLDRMPFTLSGGERQRVALGRALLAQPRLLLMDEPLASLDSQRKAEILPFLERLRDQAGVPIVYVSHALEEVERLADTLVLLQAGKVVACGPATEVMASAAARAVIGAQHFGALLAGSVTTIDTAYGLATVTFDGGLMRVAADGLQPGMRLRLRIRARDVTLSLDPPSRASVINVLAGEIAALFPGGDGETIVEIAVGRARIPASVTRLSIDRLGLRPNMAVHALVKGVAITAVGPTP